MDITATTENWLPVVGFEGSYEVSDMGRVRSVDRLDTRGRHRRGRMRSLVIMRSGHLTVTLRVDGRRVRKLVHHLVLEAFVAPRPAGLDGCHWNDNPQDNRPENLRWDTRSANILDSVRNGTHSLANKTHCPQGHAYTPANTYMYPGGSRACNECRRIYREEHAEQRRSWNRDYMRRKRVSAKAAVGAIEKVA